MKFEIGFQTEAIDETLSRLEADDEDLDDEEWEWEDEEDEEEEDEDEDEEWDMGYNEEEWN